MPKFLETPVKTELPEINKCYAKATFWIRWQRHPQSIVKSLVKLALKKPVHH